jgi:hypothetical protein
MKPGEQIMTSFRLSILGKALGFKWSEDNLSNSAGSTSSVKWSRNWLIVLIRFLQLGQPGTTMPWS